MRKKKLDENELALKWPSIFRDGIKITDHDIGILEVSMHGETEITAKDLKEMKKFGYIHERTNVYACVPKFLEGHIDILDEDYISGFLVTSVTFTRIKHLRWKNGSKSDRQVLKENSRINKAK
jgi:hypothetical protein